MNPALTIFGKIRIPFAVSPRVLAAGAETYKACSAAWASDSKPFGDAAPAGPDPIEAMIVIARARTGATNRVFLDMALSISDRDRRRPLQSRQNSEISPAPSRSLGTMFTQALAISMGRSSYAQMLPRVTRRTTVGHRVRKGRASRAAPFSS